jgi:hypothetical protein
MKVHGIEWKKMCWSLLWCSMCNDGKTQWSCCPN